MRDAPDNLDERFDAGRPLAFRIPVWVKPIDSDAVLSEFDVLLQRDDALNRADENFLREGVTVAGVRGNLPNYSHWTTPVYATEKISAAD